MGTETIYMVGGKRGAQGRGKGEFTQFITARLNNPQVRDSVTLVTELSESEIMRTEMIFITNNYLCPSIIIISLLI